MDKAISQFFAVLKAPLDQLEAWASAWLPGEALAGLAAFGVYALIILAGGLIAIGSRNLVRAMMGLIVAFLGVAGLYLLLASPFLAFMQLLIYVGAVGVLIFFAIMLTKNTSLGEEMSLPRISNGFFGLLAFFLPLLVLGSVIISKAPELGSKPYSQTPTAELGRGLVTTDLLSFELISIILLVAMAGAVFLAWSPRRASSGDRSEP
jgi:NADH-quinone oxidoreductase subunit J